MYPLISFGKQLTLLLPFPIKEASSRYPRQDLPPTRTTFSECETAQDSRATCCLFEKLE
jgi:hypothetical protein